MTKTTDPPVSDADLGAALRKIAAAYSSGVNRFDWYAAQFVRWAGDPDGLERLTANRPGRVKVLVENDASAGVLECAVEMVSGEQARVGAFDPFDATWIHDMVEGHREDLAGTTNFVVRARHEGAIDALSRVAARVQTNKTDA